MSSPPVPSPQFQKPNTKSPPSTTEETQYRNPEQNKNTRILDTEHTEKLRRLLQVEKNLSAQLRNNIEELAKVFINGPKFNTSTEAEEQRDDEDLDQMKMPPNNQAAKGKEWTLLVAKKLA